MFGSLGFPEILFILVLALLIFGPRKLPEIGRTIGRSLAEFRKASTDLKRSLNAEMIEEEMRQSDPRKILDDDFASRPAAARVDAKPEPPPADAPSGEAAEAPSGEAAEAPSGGEAAAGEAAPVPRGSIPRGDADGGVTAPPSSEPAPEPEAQ